MRTAWALAGALLLSSTSAAPSAAVEEPLPAPAAPLFGLPWMTALPQEILPGFVLVPRPAPRSKPAKATSRSDEQFFQISSTGSNDIPDAALRAYQHSAGVMSSCDIPWTFLAAVGRVESNHGRYGGSQLSSDGVSRPEIIGPQLNGAGPFAAIGDSDDGALDHDRVWDRAVGPMQFIPGTWRMVARDGDGDGTADPHDIDDAALAAAVYLCGVGNLSTLEALARAAYRYNPSDYYVQLVLSFHHGYQTGVFAVPSPPPPAGSGPSPANQPATPAPAPSTSPSPAPSPTTSPSTSPTPAPPPSTSPTPAPTPTTSPPAPSPVAEDHTGQWLACDGGYCLGDLRLDLGTDGFDEIAAADYDGDGDLEGPETEEQEFKGLLLVDRTVTVRGVLADGIIVVEQIDGMDYT